MSAWSLYKCGALWRAVYGASGTGRPLGTICEEKGISSWFWVYISRDMTLSVDSGVKPHSFLPSSILCFQDMQNFVNWRVTIYLLTKCMVSLKDSLHSNLSESLVPD